MNVQHKDKVQVQKAGAGWQISGKRGAAYFVPNSSAAWDVSAWMMGSISVKNLGSGVVTVDALLENPNAMSWQNSCPGSAVVPSGQTAVIAFPFPCRDHLYKGPAVFRDQLAKPNGHRVHWRTFNLADVRGLRLTFASSAPNFKVEISPLTMAWPTDAERDARLHGMPYLDRFGQVMALQWPGKVGSESSLKKNRSRPSWRPWSVPTRSIVSAAGRRARSTRRPGTSARKRSTGAGG